MSGFEPLIPSSGSSRGRIAPVLRSLMGAGAALAVVLVLAGHSDVLGVTRASNTNPTQRSGTNPRINRGFSLARYKEIVAASAEASDRLAQSGAQCEESAPGATLNACVGKNVGDSCTVTHDERTFTGQCAMTPMGSIVCQPPTPPPPPPAAVTACSGKQAGDACQITDDERTIDGTCKAFSTGTVACVPNPPPPPPQIDACAGKAAGDACSFTDEDEEETVSGTCATVPNHPDILACVPQREIPPAVAACDGKSAADTCTFMVDDRTVDGNCVALPVVGTLVCLPPPPQALVDACAGKSAGDACTVTLGDHTFTATCAMAPDGVTLACLPPPQEEEGEGPSPRVSACSGKTAGAMCTVQRDDRTLSGICRTDDEGDLACLPPVPPQESVDACAGKAAGDVCSFSFKDHTLSGACRALPDGTTLVCAPLCPPHWMSTKIAPTR